MRESAMRKSIAWLVLAVFAGCGGSSLSEREAKKAVRSHLELAPPFCLPVALLQSDPPWVVADRDPESRVLGSFEQVGLLSSRATTVTEQGYSALGKVTKELPAKEFELTAAGRTALVSRTMMGIKASCFRYADADVEEVTEWTEPAEQMGTVVSRVSFTAKVSSVPAWAQSETFAQLFPTESRLLAQAQDEPMPLTAGIVKTSNGWQPVAARL